MRRGSLAGPLVLILIGVWLLLSNLRQDLKLFDVAAQYWPVLLLAWGLMRLVEIFVGALRGRPWPRPGISGGEWGVVIALCLVGSFMHTVNHLSTGHWGFFQANRIEIFGRPFDYPVAEKKILAPAAPRLLIENLRGDVRVTGADVKEIIVGGRKSIRALRESDADAANRQSEVELSVQGEQIILRTNTDRVTGDQRVSIDLEVTVPRSTWVSLRGRDGYVEVNDLKGGVEVSSDDARVRLRNIGGNARLDLRKSDQVQAVNVGGTVELIGGRGGDIDLDTIGGEVTINGSYSGDLHFRNLAKPIRLQCPNTELRVERIPGEVNLDLDKFGGTNLIGPIRLSSSRSRDVEIDEFTQSLDLTVRGGDVRLRPAGATLPQIAAKTRDGNVELILPENGRFTLRAVSDRGEVTNEYGPALKVIPGRRGDEEGRHGGSIMGSVGQGPSMVVETDRGSITVRKDSGAALSTRQGHRAQEPGRAPESPAAPLPIESQ